MFDSESGQTKDDVKVPEAEVGEKIRNSMEAKNEVWVVVKAVMGEEAAIEAKEGKEA